MNLRFVAASLCGASLFAQGLAYSVATDILLPLPVRDEEVHWLSPSARRPIVPKDLLALLRGDANGNGRFDDAPTDVDALEWISGPTPGLLGSISADTTIPGGPTLRDGDVFRIGPSGFVVVHPESTFTAATGTSDVDLDAFAVAPDGTLWWSFADDETTTSPTLATVLGGNLIDRHVVFVLPPGALEATVALTKSGVVAAFNAACGTSVTTVVNTTDIALDPFHAGALLLTCGSSSSTLRGRVVSTHAGGTLFTFGGLVVDPSAFAFATAPALDGIAWMPSVPGPTLRSLVDAPSIAASDTIDLLGEGFVPGETVQLVVSPAVYPRPTFTALSGVGGFGHTPLDLADPAFALSVVSPEFRMSADGFGGIRWQRTTAGLVPTTAFVQAYGTTGGAVSTPVGVTVAP